MENILVLSSVIFPNRSPRAHRATELAKELARKGHNVTLCAVLGEYDYSTFETENRVKVDDLGVSIFDESTSDVDGRFRSKLIRRINALLSYPFQFPECLIGLRVRKYLRKTGDFDRIISVAVPYPIHWGTGFAKRHFKKVKETIWISDCGDPFMGNPMSKHPFYFKWVEKKWCRSTDYITVPTSVSVGGYYPEFKEKIRVIPQGFCFDDIKLAVYHRNVIPTFAYSGVVYAGTRDPRQLLEYLATIPFNFKFVVYSKSSPFKKYQSLLGDKLEIRPYIQHDELIYELSKFDFLINIQNESSVQVPSKLIDYYMTGRPIINITSAFTEREIFEEFIEGNYNHQFVLESPEQYNIKNVANQFLELGK